MKFAHSVSAFVFTFGLATSAFAATSTVDLMKKCDQESARESVLTELEQESGINFNLESLSGNAELTNMVQEAQTRKFTDVSARALSHIRTILKITLQGVEQGKAASLKESAYQDKKAISVIGNFFSTMMDLFAPVLDFTEQGLKAQAKGQTISEMEVKILMTDLEAKSNIYNGSLVALTKFQSSLENTSEENRALANTQMDNLVSNINIQTCLAAVKEIRK